MNRSGSITARDISELRKLILGVQNQFDNNPSWNFIDANAPIGFDNYMTFQANAAIKQMNQNFTSVNFVAVKTGDVTGEANTGFGGINTRGRQVFPLMLIEASYTAGEEVVLPIHVNEQTVISGLQMAIELTTNDLEWVGIRSNKCEIESDQFIIVNKTLRLSWNQNANIALKEGDTMFELVLHAKKSGKIQATDLVMNHQAMLAESYHSDSDRDVQLIIRDQDSNKDYKGYALYQNVPNPFKDETTLYFSAPESGEAVISIYSLSGNLLKNMRVNANAGLNQWIVSAESLELSGVLYYRLEMNGFSSMRKMVIIK